MTHDQIAREMQEADRIRAMIAERSGKNISDAMKAMQDGPTSGWYGKAMEAVKDFATWTKEAGQGVKQEMKEFNVWTREVGEDLANEMRVSPAAQAYDSARTIMADVNRRVFEEPWFGKSVADILFERQQGTVHGRDRLEDQEAARDGQYTIHGQVTIQQEEQTTIHGKNEPQSEEQETIHSKNEPEQEQESAWDKLYGNMQAAEQERGQDQDAGR